MDLIWKRDDCAGVIECIAGVAGVRYLSKYDRPSSSGTVHGTFFTEIVLFFHRRRFCINCSTIPDMGADSVYGTLTQQRLNPNMVSVVG